MVSLVRRLGKRKRFQGLRPMEIPRDADAVAQLLEETFDPSKDRESREVVREFRMLRYLGLLVWPEEWLGPGSGYVWEDEGRVVGNATITALPGHRDIWVLANVAVHPDYRRRGIGRALVEGSLALARSQGAEVVTLEVEHSNLPAQRIYRRLGFQMVEGVVDLIRDRVEKVTPPLLPPQLRWRELGEGEGARRYELYRASYPPSREKLRPLRTADFRMAPERMLTDRLGAILWGPALRRWALEEGGRLAAILTLSGLRRPPRRLEMVVHPNYLGVLESTLVGQGLHILASYPPAEVTASAFLSHPQALEALKSHGFREVRVMEQLELRLGRR